VTQKLFDGFESLKSNRAGVMTESERLRFNIHSNANQIKDLMESYEAFQEATSPA
jgi:hypothetical protein